MNCLAFMIYNKLLYIKELALYRLARLNNGQIV